MAYIERAISDVVEKRVKSCISAWHSEGIIQ